MNYLELKVDSDMKEGPVMLEGFHEKEMELWFGEMMEFDRNVTKIVRILIFFEVKFALKTSKSAKNQMCKFLDIGKLGKYVYFFSYFSARQIANFLKFVLTQEIAKCIRLSFV